jgi:hypothetical protein
MFSEDAVRRFETKMVKHLCEFSPMLAKASGEESLRKAIRAGIMRASKYGFTCQGPVRLYLELMLLLGCEFDTDPQYPWVTQTLIDQNAGPQMQRAEQLYERVLDYQAKIAGPRNDYRSVVLGDIAFLSTVLLSLPGRQNFIPDMLREITQRYPHKAACAREEGLEALIRRAFNIARSQRLSSARGMALIVALMLLFGHGFIGDPLYMWITQPIAETALVEPMTRVNYLELKVLAWLEQMVIYLGKGAKS